MQIDHGWHRASGRLVWVALALFWIGCGGDDAGLSQTEEGALVLGAVEETARVERGVLPAGRTLVLDGFRGTIRLEGSDDDVARLVFVKTARGKDANDATRALEAITLEESGDDASFGYTLRSKNPDLSAVRIEGTVPRQTPLRLRMASGRVALSGLDGPIDVALQGGDVEIGGAGESVQVETRNGSVEAGFYRLADGSTIRLQTTNGNLGLTLPAGVAASVEAQTSAGTIVTEGLDFADRRLSPDGAGARFSGRLGREGSAVRLRTENGAITLREGTVQRLDALAETPSDTTSALPDTTSLLMTPPDTSSVLLDTSVVLPDTSDTSR